MTENLHNLSQEMSDILNSVLNYQNEETLIPFLKVELLKDLLRPIELETVPGCVQRYCNINLLAAQQQTFKVDKKKLLLCSQVNILQIEHGRR